MLKFKSTSFLIILILLLSSCASPVYKYFHPVSVNNANQPQSCVSPEIHSINSPNKSLREYYQEGWVEVGYSSWNDEASDIDSALLKKAREINACLVLVYRKQTGSEIEEMPEDSMMMPMWGYGYYPGYYGGFTTYAPYTVFLYQYNIFFLIHMENFYSGLYVTDLNTTARKALQTNKGVIVALVVNNSPAYNADIIPGDIITNIGKFKLTNTQSFYHAISFYQGESSLFSLYRNGKSLTKVVNLSKQLANVNYYESREK